MGRLIVKFPSRNRPEKFKARFERYASFLSGRHQVRFVLSFDEDDPTMNNEPMRAWLDRQGRMLDIKYRYGHSQTKIEAVNADMDGEDGDVLLVASDDMNPVRRRYDDVIFDAFERTFPDFFGAIKFWDGHRPQTDPLMTLAVVGFPVYRRLGYIYYPELVSLYGDNDQTQVCARLGRLAMSPICIIRHEWTHEPFDALHARNEDEELYRRDAAVFGARHARRFDLDSTFGPGADRGVPIAKPVAHGHPLSRVWRRLFASARR
jgi:hypothetical protein